MFDDPNLCWDKSCYPFYWHVELNSFWTSWREVRTKGISSELILYLYFFPLVISDAIKVLLLNLLGYLGSSVYFKTLTPLFLVFELLLAAFDLYDYGKVLEFCFYDELFYFWILSFVFDYLDSILSSDYYYKLLWSFKA